MIEDLKNIIEPATKIHNCEFWGIEVLRGKKRPTLRVFIDTEIGATIEDCENVSKDLNYEAEIDNILGDDYILEVSTPGVERKFFNTSQLHDYVGEKLKIKLKNPMNNMKNINGKLLDVVHESFFVNFNDESIELNFDDVDSCILIPDYKKLFKDKNNAK